MPYFLTFLITLLTTALLWQIYSNYQKKKTIQEIRSKLVELLQIDCKNDMLSLESDLTILFKELETMFHDHLHLLSEYNKKERAVDKAISLHSKDLLDATLTTIQELSQEENISFEVQKKLYRCQSNVENTRTLLHRVRTSFLVEHRKKITKCVLNINEICHNNILNFYDEISGKGLEIQIDIPKEPIFLTSNKEILNQVLKIIILNLISYCEDGQIIGITLDNDERFVSIEVWDRRKVDRPDEDWTSKCSYALDCQLQNQESDLYIAKQMVEALGGELSLSNNFAYHATSFTVKLDKAA